MDLQLDRKRALVTGSTSGIGAGIAEALAREGAVVVIHGRDAARAEQVVQEIVSQGGRACIAIGDLATDEGGQRVAEQAVAAVGAIDVLINNAGKYENRGWTDATADDWADLYNANVLSAVRMIRLLAPQMKARRWGRIIQLASGEATQPFAFYA